MKMKKLLSSVLSLALCGMISASYCSAAEKLPPTKDMDLEEGSIWLIGDVDSSGVIDVSDLTLLSLYLIGDTDMNDGQKISSDCNSDASLDLTDLANLAYYISKKDRIDNTVVIGTTRQISHKGSIDRPMPSPPASPTPAPSESSSPSPSPTNSIDRPLPPEDFINPPEREDSTYDRATYSNETYSRWAVFIFDESKLDEKKINPFFRSEEEHTGMMDFCKTFTGISSCEMFLLKCGKDEGKYYVFLNDNLSDERVKEIFEELGLIDYTEPDKTDISFETEQPIPTPVPTAVPEPSPTPAVTY